MSETLNSPRTFNNRLFVEEYKNEGGLKTTYAHGMAMVAQKISLKGLVVLAETKLSDGTVIPKGSTAYIREELLHAQPWAKKVFELGASKGIFVDLQYVDLVQPPSQKQDIDF